MISRAHRWALKAYELSATANQNGKLEDFEGDIQSFAASLRRSGLVVGLSQAISNGRAPDLFFAALNALDIPGFKGMTQAGKKLGPEMVTRAASLPLDQYLVAVEQMLAGVTWLRRAVRAQKAALEAAKAGPSLAEPQAGS